MVSGPDEQYDAVGYDWDGDGKAEILLRGADNMIIYHADGTTTNIGNMNVNTRNTVQQTANMTYTNTGADEESNPPEDINGETVSIVENIRLQEAQTALNNESIRRYRFYCKIPFPTNIDKDEELTIKPKITVRQYIN